MTHETPQPGAWYLGRNCRFCGEFIPMFPDRAGGGVGLRFGAPSVHEFECPHCHRSGEYATVQMKRQRIPEAD